jgi:hypothetical protein
MSELEDKLTPLRRSEVVKFPENLDEKQGALYKNYLHFFQKYNFLEIE